MGCIHEKHMAFTLARGLEQWFQLGFQELRLGRGMFLNGLFRGQGDGGDAPPFQTEHFFRKARTWVGRRSMPVSSLIRWQASATVWGGLRRKDSSKDSRCFSSSLTPLPQCNFRKASRPP